MLPPDYINSLPNGMVELYAQAEADILADMARRIKEYDYGIPAAQHQVVKLKEMGMAREEILKRLSSVMGESQKELKQLMKDAALKTIKGEDETYKAAGLSPPALAESIALQKALNAGLKRTSGTFKNLSKTTANTASRQFENALDRAWLQITSGAFDYNTAVRNAVKDLSRAGVGAIKYPSGRVDNLEAAVRRATITGVNQTQGELVEERRKEMGNNLVEVSAHAGARPDHAQWQGGIYWTIEKDADYPKNFTETCGYGRGDGIYGWNCSHSHRAYIKGMPRTYTKEMLEKYEAEDYEYNGKKLTEYEANQQQRYIERQIRRWKREEVAMKAAKEDTSEAAAKIKKWQAKQRDFLDQTGLKRQSSREQIGYISKPTSPPFSSLMTGKLKDYSEAEIRTIAQETGAIVKKYVVAESKWSGKVIVDSNAVQYGKLWNCDIATSVNTSPHILLHEQLHACSISHFDGITYAKYRRIEEATVQFTAQEISKLEGIHIIESGYDEIANCLRKINSKVGLYNTDLEFAQKLIDVPVPERLEWLENTVYNKLSKDGSAQLYGEIGKLIESLY